MTDVSQPTVTLNDGRTMPQLGLGVWQTPPEETAAVMRDAIACGYQAIDTAAIYQNEEGVGEGLQDHPEAFLTTKLWNADQGYDSALRAFDLSAGKLRREKIDLYLIHWPAPHRDQYVDSWKALVRLQEEGRAKSIGVSNFTAAHLERIIAETGVIPAVNQIELHPRFQQISLRAFHTEHGVHTESWSPLGQGASMEEPALTEIAAKYGKTAAQVVIRWHLDSDLIVIPKTVRRERMLENLDVSDFRLDDGDMARIAGLDSADGRLGPHPDTATF